MNSVWAKVTALTLAAKFTSSGGAETTPLHVELNQCPDLNPREISRLLDLELSSVERDRAMSVMPPVKLVCELAQIRVTVDDPVTNKTLSREIVAPAPNDPTGNRIVALAIAELFASSWLELLLPPERRVVRSKLPNRTDARLTQVTENAIAPKPIPWELGLDAAVRLRDLQSPFWGYRPSLSTAWLIHDRYRLLFAGSLEYSRVSRASGNVVSRSTSLGSGAGLRITLGERLYWDADLLLSLVLVRANGESNTDAMIERSATGLGVDAALKSGPMIRLGVFFAKLELQSGLTYPRFTARVPGDAPVQLGGLWVGFGIALGLSEARP
jgi:hypothetical protein